MYRKYLLYESYLFAVVLSARNIEKQKSRMANTAKAQT